VLRQSRATQRYLPLVRNDEAPLTQRIIELAALYGRYGTPRITSILQEEGWQVNHKRVERIWRREGLKVPQKQRKRGRLWLNDGIVHSVATGTQGSCLGVRLCKRSNP